MKETKNALDNATDFQPDISQIEIIGVNQYMNLNVKETERIVQYLFDSQSFVFVVHRSVSKLLHPL